MRAKTVNEIQNFERGLNPKDAMNVGKKALDRTVFTDGGGEIKMNELTLRAEIEVEYEEFNQKNVLRDIKRWLKGIYYANTAHNFGMRFDEYDNALQDLGYKVDHSAARKGDFEIFGGEDWSCVKFKIKKIKK